MKFTGVGSRKLSDSLRGFITEAGVIMSNNGYEGVSGGAVGADACFQLGVEQAGGKFTCFMPFSGYCDVSTNHLTISMVANTLHNYHEAEAIASTLHPIWNQLNKVEKQLHTRNVYEVLGEDLNTPSDVFLLCAPPDGNKSVKGGTNTAFQLALRYEIPYYNFYKAMDRIRFKSNFK